MREQILLVEDDDTIVFGLSELLGQEGFLVRAVSSLAEAQHLGEELRFGLVLLDLGLPDGEGWELLEKREAGAPPVIILSAREEERDIIR